MFRSWYRSATVVTAFLGCMALYSGASVRACAIDQKPSVYADGLLARINGVTPTTQAQLASWSYFVFARTFSARQAIVLTEDRREVARTLMPSALRYPWGWLFGDGHFATGWTVHHVYARAGHWRIGVYAYNPESKQWNLFDQVTLTTR